MVTWYSFVESELEEFCLLSQKEFKRSQSLKDFCKDMKQESRISQIKKYLLMIGVVLSQDKWEELNNIRLLRNKIAHLGPDFSIKLGEYKGKFKKVY